VLLKKRKKKIVGKKTNQIGGGDQGEDQGRPGVTKRNTLMYGQEKQKKRKK